MMIPVCYLLGVAAAREYAVPYIGDMELDWRLAYMRGYEKEYRRLHRVGRWGEDDDGVI